MNSVSCLLKLEIAPERRDCFAAVPTRYVQETVRPMFPSSLPTVVALKIEPIDEGSAKRQKTDHFVGMVSYHAHQRDGVMLVSPALLQALGMSHGSVVSATPLRGDAVKDAQSVFVSPHSVDDSEIVEHNQRHIEGVLLRQLRVVYEGLVVAVPVHSGVTVRLQFGKVNFVGWKEGDSGAPPRCAMLTEGTELYVSTRSRQQPTDNKALEPQASVVRMNVIPQPQREAICKSTPDAATRVFVAKAFAERYHWRDGITVGVLPLPFVGDLAMESSAGGRNSNTSQAARMSAQLGLGSHEPEHFSVTSPSTLRSIARKCTLKVLEEDHTLMKDIKVSGTDACYWLPAVGSTCIVTSHSVFVFPNPASQVQDGPAAAKDATKRLAVVSSTCEVKALHSVFGETFIQSIEQHISGSLLGLSTKASSATCHHIPPLLITGSRGSGKTTVVEAALAAASSYAYCTRMDCSGRSADSDMMNEIRTVLLDAMVSAPSVVCFDNLNAIFPADVEGAGSGSNASKSAVAAMKSLLMLPAATGIPVLLIATSTSKEALHEELRSTPTTFARVLSMPPLTAQGRAAVLSTLLADKGLDAKSCHRVALKLDNYSVHDVVKVAGKAICSRATKEEWTLASLEAAVLDATTDYKPLAHQGINFLKTGDGDSDALTWDDVAALAAPKKAMYEAVVLPTKFPELFATLPLKTRSGVLLYGPPGCGKSYILSALVAAFRLNCIVVNGPEILDKYIGASEQKVRDVFERAQAAAPCVLFFDEFDSIAPQRGHDNTGVTDRVVNQLLCYLDGVEGRSNVFVVAASSRPDLIDAALLRPGRLDKAVFCSLPTEPERKEILKVHTKKIALSGDVDLDTLSELTEGWTSADLAGLVSTVNIRLVSRKLEAATLGLTGAGGSSLSVDEKPTAESVFEVAAPKADMRRKTMEGLQDGMELLAQRLGFSSTGGQDAFNMSPRSKVGDGADGTKQLATMEDFMAGLQETRPSISVKEARMYDAIYSKFAKSRQPKGANRTEADEPAFVPDQRTTMA